MESKRKKPLVFTEEMKNETEARLSGFTYINHRRWNKNRTSYKFYIAELPCKVVVAPTRGIDDDKCVYFKRKGRNEWVFNAYSYHLKGKKLIKVMLEVFDLIDLHRTEENFDRMAEIAKSNNINPKTLKYKCFEKDDCVIVDIDDSDEDKYEAMVETLTKLALGYLDIKSDCYGTVYYILRNMAHVLLMSYLDDFDSTHPIYLSYYRLSHKILID
jgi:hypothetical protein